MGLPEQQEASDKSFSGRNCWILFSCWSKYYDTVERPVIVSPLFLCSSFLLFTSETVEENIQKIHLYLCLSHFTDLPHWFTIMLRHHAFSHVNYADHVLVCMCYYDNYNDRTSDTVTWSVGVVSPLYNQCTCVHWNGRAKHFYYTIWINPSMNLNFFIHFLLLSFNNNDGEWLMKAGTKYKWAVMWRLKETQSVSLLNA